MDEIAEEVLRKKVLLKKLERFLAVRPRSVKEVYDYLRYRRKSSEGTTGQIIDELKQTGILDDPVFARWYFSNRLTYSRLGISRILIELREKGIKEDILSGILSSPDHREEEWHKLVKEIDRQYSPDIILQIKEKKIDKIKYQQKVFNKLMSRGYDYNHIKELIAERLAALV